MAKRKSRRISIKTCQMVKRAAQYVGKGIADGAYTTTVGGDRVPTQLLEHMEQWIQKNCR